MRAPQVLALACLAQLACDVKKLGIEGATCSASSDCADDLQCMQSVCVRPQAAGVAARPAPPPAPSVPVPVARDGRIEPHRRQGTGDAQLDGAIDNAIGSLKVAAPPPEVRAQLAGTCKKIPYDFTMKIAGGKTEVK